uniref:PEP-CTERM sorting domain-containing protein n=1 Tax=Eiseniibacteriota bacterium TaxID=2212470 RepID=A0A832MLS7_UNCEI
MMKRKIGVTVMAGLLALGALAPVASAQCPPLGSPSFPMIEFDANCFAYETNYTPATFNSAAGSQLTIVGIIDLFYAPLTFLNPADPAKEYTFVITGLTSGGTTTVPLGPTTLYLTDYAGGSFAIYEGSPENAPLAGAMPPNPPNATVPANFQDGTMLLSGVLCGFRTEISKTGTGPANGSFRANYHFTGGTLFNTVGDAEALLSGLWNVASPLPAGYSAHPNGKFDSPPSTSAKNSTWGSIKSLYR